MPLTLLPGEALRDLRKLYRRWLPRVAALGAATLSLAACGDLLTVTSPDQVVASTLNDPLLAPQLVNGAIADFECAYTNYAAATGALTDEFDVSTAFINWTVWDARILQPNDVSLQGNDCTVGAWSVYGPLQTARFQAEGTAKRLEGWTDQQVPNRTSLLATAYAYAGYAYTLLGEGFCEMAIDVGPLLQPDSVLALAEARFTSAITNAQASNNTAILNMALVGRARVRLDRGKGSLAATDAALVPAGFRRDATYSSVNERRKNTVWTRNQRDLYTSVAATFRNLAFDGVADPRVPVTNANRRGNDGLTPLWYQMKYKADNAPIPLATYEEAQLIIAEVQGGQAAVDAINRIHAANGLPAFASTDPAAIAAQVREERRRQFFADGHRLNDMLRFKLPFPTGQTLAGIPYGTVTCIPLSDAERNNNPNVGR
ncbi:MAG TPA: RagB/SusD family nutrient uptake outer membrane protein [Longimicrobiales bacterium]|nr:RagB/SusD family nutrient uptake outer membrane protein [Longimicrobiales bacterium]